MKKFNKLAPTFLTGLGIVLLILMIVVEDEPGAVPLLLIGIGSVWFGINKYKSRKQDN
jgi:hypothetical protein